MVVHVKTVKLNQFQKLKEKGEMSDKPLILVILSPLMTRAHSKVKQAGELVIASQWHLWTDSTPPFIFCPLPAVHQVYL